MRILDLRHTSRVCLPEGGSLPEVSMRKVLYGSLRVPSSRILLQLLLQHPMSSLISSS